ncbi:MAG TPA: LacI family DNA-binding transcriptional regulator [Rhodobacteraceae bacterium]|nr:LacI family DNA-binding transcriptional regulator [Paracoccaceae bacterium]
MTRSKKTVTSSDVARMAGVSRSAVSRTYTKGASISEKTRARVIEAAESLGYRPNAMARSLITRTSGIIGLVMADLSNPFYGEVLETLSEKLQQMDLHVLLFSVSRAHDIDDALPALLQYQVDGVIITSAILTSEMARRCTRAGRPVVLFNRYVADNSISTVCTDNIAGGRMIADLMVKTGRRRLAFMAGTEDTSTSNDRQAGFYGRIQELGIDAPLFDRGDYSYEGGVEAARRLLGHHPRPDALFCANDMMALAALDVARTELGLDVPGDLAIAGFDDIPQAGWMNNSITTIHQDIEAMTTATIDILIERVKKPDVLPLRKTIPGKLVVRSTCPATVTPSNPG